MLIRTLLLPLLTVAVLAASGAASAQTVANANGIDYVSGGVGLGERNALQQQQPSYSFWLRTALKGSGEYLAGTRLRITRVGQNASLIDITLDGPWFLAALPPGRYTVEVSYQPAGGAAQTQRQTVRIGQGQREMMAYFSVAP